MKKRSSSEKEFEVLFDNEFEIIIKFIQKIVRSKETAEDIVAEAFSRCYAHWVKLQNHEAPGKWLTCASFNLAMDHLRKVTRDDKFISLFSKQDFDSEPIVVNNSIDLYLKGLSKKQQEILLLKYVCDFSTDEICELLSLKPTTVYTQLQRAQEKLKITLKKERLSEA